VIAKQIQILGLIGVGRMGLGLGRNLLLRGFKVQAYDPSEAALGEISALGASSAVSVAAAATGADAVITCLPDVATVRSVYHGPNGLFAVAEPGCLFIEMTSSEAALTRELGSVAREHGYGVVDAPMLRGAPQAWDGTVHVLVGGTTSDKARSWPVLSAVSERVMDVGPLGSAHALKAVNNAVTMANNAVLAEAMMAGKQLGFTPGQLVEVLSGGLSTRLLDLYGPRFVSGEHPPTTALAVGEKDLGIFLRTAGEASLATPVIEAAYRIYETMLAKGLGGEPPSRMADFLGEAISDPSAPYFMKEGSAPMRPLTVDPKTTALVLIDLQHGIVAMPVAPRTGAAVVDAAASIANELRSAGGFVVLVRVTPSADGGDALQPATDQPVPVPAERPADWADLVPDIQGPGDLVVTKRQWGAFYGTELDLQLRRRGIRTIILAGIATHIGVESTARDAYEHGYDQVFVEDAMASPSAEAHAATLRTIFPRIGKLRTTAEVLEAIRASAQH
jgi:3-hydroxyisobutyrate dehydrogenase-like beta-hydroxyacid dehydrogenase/nicotinamidase-related amidase